MRDTSYFIRAMRAYFKRFGEYANQPAGTGVDDNVREYKGRRYVVLDNCNGLLATYRITPSDGLRWVQRLPKAALGEWGYDKAEPALRYPL